MSLVSRFADRWRTSTVLASCCALFALCLPRLPAAPQNAPPASKPVLRIETGMHTASINQIALDKAGRCLVTGSDDKTVRVWDAKTGTLLRTLRLPLGAGAEGKVYAVAITPDGKTIICGGFTALDDANDYPLYVFNQASGALIRRITGLPNVTTALAVSPRGTLLAATLGGGGGVRVFRLADGKMIGLNTAHPGADKTYQAGSYGVDFDPTGSYLITTCEDGYLRRYAVGSVTGLRPLNKVKAPGGGQPCSVRFSPDGSQIAVGYYDTSTVSVLSAADFSSRATPNPAGAAKGNLVNACWSADGKALFAGGRASDKDHLTFVRRWADTGKKGFSDKPIADTDISDLQAAGNTLFYATAEPRLGALFAQTMLPRWRNAAQTLDFRSTTLGLERDGIAVQFSYAHDPKKQARFDIGRHELIVRAADNKTVFALGDLTSPPVTTYAGLRITDWQNHLAPKRNGSPLELAPLETSCSLAVAPDGATFILGTEWLVHCFGRDGMERWKVAAPGIVWGVNVSRDNKVVVAAFGDGTVRWYRLSDGQELCALFVHADLKRWVLWTPSGYYDCSPGGEDLIGWHINRGQDKEADFFSAAQFRNTFYRPDILAQILKTYSEADAVRVANAARGDIAPTPAANADTVAQNLPPVLMLSSNRPPVFSSHQVRVAFTLRTPGDAPLLQILAFVDGRPVPLPPSALAGEADIPVMPGNQFVSLIALNKNAVSQPVVVTIPGAKGAFGNSLPAEPVFVAKPKLYVLAVGINTYAQKERNLHFAANDVADFATAMKAQEGGLYETVTVKVLTDADATHDNVVDGLEWIRRQTTSRDVAMIYFSGHGANNADGNYYFLTHNFDGEHWERTAVSFDVIKSTIPHIAGKVVFFLDSCHSGNVLNTQREKGDAPDIVRVVNELSSAQNGVIVFAASTGRQVALEDSKWGHGAFTKAVLEGLGGEADYRKTGRVTVKMLDVYVSERVKVLTAGAQTPTTPRLDAIVNATGDFPVALKR